MDSNAQTARPVVFFDGGCPLCRREITHYQRPDHQHKVRWVDIHAQPDSLHPYGVSWETAMQRIHLLESDGRMVTGAAAFAALWQRLPYYRLLAALTTLPGVLPLLEKAYSAFAEWRWKSRREASCGTGGGCL